LLLEICIVLRNKKNVKVKAGDKEGGGGHTISLELAVL
jgi:hypothetical protein